jgi:hypothetical protein
MALDNVDVLDMYILDERGKVAQDKRLGRATEEANEESSVLRT